MSMTVAGSICWAIDIALGLLFQFVSWNKMDWKGVALKGATSLGITAYAIVLIVMGGRASEAAALFVSGLLLCSLGDILIGAVQTKDDGRSSAILDSVEGVEKKVDLSFVIVCLAGVTYIISYFLQMVGFVKGLSLRADPADYIIAFLVFFLVPPLFTAIGGLLSRFRIPEVPTNAFIIGVFYILLTSALFASTAVFAFSMFQEDQNHATFILIGAILYFLSILFILLRYSNPEKYESRAMRTFSRVLTFGGRMILAGCAFLF